MDFNISVLHYLEIHLSQGVFSFSWKDSTMTARCVFLVSVFLQLYMTQPLRMRCTRDFHEMLENRMSTSKNIVLVCKYELYNIFLEKLPISI